METNGRMNPQDLTHLKEQYAQMRIDNRPIAPTELLTEHPSIEREKVWPQWLLDEEKGIGEFKAGSLVIREIRRQRFETTWKNILFPNKIRIHLGYRITYEGSEYWFSPQANVLYRRIGKKTDMDSRIQPAIHLLIKAMD